MDVPWRTFNIHVTFPLHKSFFIVQKTSLYYENALHSKKKKNSTYVPFTERFWWFFCGITAKIPFWKLYF